MKYISILIASFILLIATVSPAAAKTSYSLFFSTGSGYGALPMYADIFMPYGYNGYNTWGNSYPGYNGYNLFSPLQPQIGQPSMAFPYIPNTGLPSVPFSSMMGYNGFGSTPYYGGGYDGLNSGLFGYPNTYNGYASWNSRNSYNSGWSYCSVYVSCSCACSR